MPTAPKLYVEADVSCWSSGIAAGAGPHLPIGYWSTAHYRAAMRFPKPAWAAWTAITSAKLVFYISDHAHVGVRNSSIYVRRQIQADLWLAAAGTQNCDSGFTGSNTTQYGDINPTASNAATFSSGSTANASKIVDVTEMLKSYWANDSKIVFVFDAVGSGDYTELWSDEKSGYDAYLDIDYETASPPSQPTLVYPAASAQIAEVNPDFDWTHVDPQGDAQSQANVQLWDAAGTTLLYTWNVAGATSHLVSPVALTRGTTYQYAVQTADAVSGFGSYSAKRVFSVKGNPVVTITAARKMLWANGAPRLQVDWTVDQPMSTVQITCTGYDSGILPISGSSGSHVLSTKALVDNTAVAVTVTVKNTDAAPLTGAATRSFTPRYGLTVHRRDLGATPVTSWVSAVPTATIPSGCDLHVEYGSDPAAVAAPAAWFDDIGLVPLNRYVFYRAWFIPSASAGPTLSQVVITSTQGAVAAINLDKWSTTRGASAGLTGPWKIDEKEFVYGSRSVQADMTGGGVTSYLYSQPIVLKRDRSYILTGLMKSILNSGAQIRLEDTAGNILLGGGVLFPPNSPVLTDALVTDKGWFDPIQFDVVRYATPVYKAIGTAPETVYVVLKVAGVTGSKAWFDAIKLEESTVATPWSPGAVGATIVDAGGVQVDAVKGGVFRYRGATGGVRDVVEGYNSGLRFGGDTELTAPATGVLAANGVPLATVPIAPIRRVYNANATWTKPANLAFIEVEVVGGGGAGNQTPAQTAGNSGFSSGGGAGGYAKKVFTAADLAGAATCAVVVAAAVGSGANGNNSSFAGTGITTVLGSGGAVGLVHSASAVPVGRSGGAGGAASGGDINIVGSFGGVGARLGALTIGGPGGNSMLGSGANSVTSATSTISVVGNDAVGPGGGGGGSQVQGAAALANGGAGGPGQVIVTEYYMGAGSVMPSALAVTDGYNPGYDPDRPGGGTQLLTDEFNDGAVDAAWSWTGTAPAAWGESEMRGKMRVHFTSGGAAPGVLVRAFVPGAGVAFTAVTKVAIAADASDSPTTAAGGGIALVDAANANISQLTVVSGTTVPRYASTRLSVNGTLVVVNDVVGNWMYLMITRSAANVYNLYYSVNGFDWNWVGTNTSATAVAKVALLNNTMTGGYTETHDFVRVIDGVTFIVGATV